MSGLALVGVLVLHPEGGGGGGMTTIASSMREREQPRETRMILGFARRLRKASTAMKFLLSYHPKKIFRRAASRDDNTRRSSITIVGVERVVLV
jgi:hypothetical protein